MSQQSVSRVLWAPAVDRNGLQLTGNTVVCSMRRTTKLTVSCVVTSLPPTPAFTEIELPALFPRVLLAQ